MNADGCDKETDANIYEKIFEIQPLFNFVKTVFKKIPKERASVGKPYPRVDITVTFEDSWYDQPLKDGEGEILIIGNLVRVNFLIPLV